jgi:hypothetical protein
MDAGKQQRTPTFPSFLSSDAATKIWNTRNGASFSSAARTEWKNEEKALH